MAKTSDPYELFLKALSKQSLAYEEVIAKLEQLLDLDLPLDLESLQFFGLNLCLNKANKLSLKSRFTPLKEQSFCIVDIECTGSVSQGEIVELAAVRMVDGKIIASFESLIRVAKIPQNIVKLTGINDKMCENAPRKKAVLNDFRLFLADSIFVAHNVNSDYKYLQKALSLADLGPLLNQKLCTLKLASKLIKAPKHGLAHLKERLNIKSNHHRALSDAKAATQVLIHCLDKLPRHIKYTEDLLNF